MAGHSKFKNIMYRKGAQDARRSKLFSKLSREITVAAKLGGPDSDANPRLRGAIVAARGQSMPNDNIDRAIKRAEGGDAETYEEVQYEGFGPGGVLVIVEGLTDNRNRTAAEVRTKFAKNGGNMGETGSVTYLFDRVGAIKYPPSAGSPDDVFEAALEAGADDCESSDDGHDILCQAGDLHMVGEALTASLGEPDKASLIWRPQTTVEVDEDKAATLFKLLEALDDDDDVQNVYANFEISDQLMEKLSA